ncbi:hypothetical protein HDV05_005868 [Chytridiales sp. JEL 0842]|nr:hypothetical protein HDV05_005868 [Chytridiales sp. JEL 0842]
MPSKNKKKSNNANKAAASSSPAPAAATTTTPAPAAAPAQKQQPQSVAAAAAAALAALKKPQPAITPEEAAGKVRRAPLLTADDALQPIVSTALLEIFARFDFDNDFALSNEELEAFAIATNGEKFEEDAIAELKKSFNVDANGNLTRQGFLEMYQLQTLSDPNETWRDLIKHGYSVRLSLVKRTTGSADPEWKTKYPAAAAAAAKKAKA